MSVCFHPFDTFDIWSFFISIDIFSFLLYFHFTVRPWNSSSLCYTIHQVPNTKEVKYYQLKPNNIWTYEFSKRSERLIEREFFSVFLVVIVAVRNAKCVKLSCNVVWSNIHCRKGNDIIDLSIRKIKYISTDTKCYDPLHRTIFNFSTRIFHMAMCRRKNQY